MENQVVMFYESKHARIFIFFDDRVSEDISHSVSLLFIREYAQGFADTLGPIRSGWQSCPDAWQDFLVLVRKDIRGTLPGPQASHYEIYGVNNGSQ